VSCRLPPHQNEHDSNPDKSYDIRIKPIPGSKYEYEIHNSSQTQMELNDKKIENKSKSDIDVIYVIGKDSLNNTIVSVNYNKIHIYSKINDDETELDAANAGNSINPAEKLLGILMGANMKATLNSAGEVVSMTGYKEMADQVIANIQSEDPETRIAIQKQWKDFIEQKLVKKNIEEIFGIYPDSAMHIGGTWNSITKEKGDMNFLVKNQYTLQSISDGIAEIESHGQMTADSTSLKYMGFDVNSNLSGSQEGSYEVDIKTGMLKGCKMTANVEGSVQVLGHEVPFKVDIKVEMEGKKI
jgi:hypothetical protein